MNHSWRQVIKTKENDVLLTASMVDEPLISSMVHRAGNEPNQLDNSSKLDSTINSLNLVHEPNELNLSWKLSSLNKWAEFELYMVRLGWFISWLDSIYTCIFNLRLIVFYPPVI